MSHKKTRSRASSILLLTVLAAATLPATTLEPLNLQDLSRRSPRIFEGECLSVSHGIDRRGLPYTSYAFRVTDAIRGAGNGHVLTVKQFGLPPDASPAEYGGLVLRVVDMPHYVRGQRYLLFLPQESRWGFASPVGLQQGAFRILGQGERRMAVNGLGNRNLALDTSQTLEQRLAARRAGRAPETVEGPVSYAALRSVVEEVLNGRQLTARQLALQLKGGR